MAEKVYALDEGGNRIETLSAEQILEAIETAIKTGEIPAELQTFIDTIREQNKGAGLKFWLGTQAEFLALESTSEDVIYFINDSTNLRDVADALTKLSEQLKDGSFKVKKAEAADSAANVSEKINNKAVTDIFEKDGVTAKKATKAEAADSAANVSEKINSKAIKDIFESDGVTAKHTTTAKNIEQTVIYNGESVSLGGFFTASEAIESGRRYLLVFDNGQTAEGVAFSSTWTGISEEGSGQKVSGSQIFAPNIDIGGDSANDILIKCVNVRAKQGATRWRYSCLSYNLNETGTYSSTLKLKKIIKCEKYDI